MVHIQTAMLNVNCTCTVDHQIQRAWFTLFPPSLFKQQQVYTSSPPLKFSAPNALHS